MLKKSTRVKNSKIVHDVHKEKNLEGILISSLSFISKLNFNEIEDSKLENEKVEIIEKSFKIIGLLIESLNPCDVPLTGARIMVKLAYHDFKPFLNFLKNIFNQFQKELSDYDDTNVKRIIRTMLKHVNNVVELTYNYSELSSKLDNDVKLIYEVCFNFLKFQQFDLNKLSDNPFDLLVDIDDITGQCVIFFFNIFLKFF